MRGAAAVVCSPISGMVRQCGKGYRVGGLAGGDFGHLGSDWVFGG